MTSRAMTSQEVRSRIVEEKIVPVVRAATPEQAIASTKAICAGGIALAEITMTVPGAIEVIRELRRTTHMLVGAGTVLDEKTARECVNAGAQFLVSPGFDLPTVCFAQEAGIFSMPGALTPTEIITAWRSGAGAAKIFPCGNVGGPSYIQALKAALPQIEMVPTGGVNLGNAPQFIRAGALAVGVGAELVDKRAIEGGNLEIITETARQFVVAMKGLDQ
jgi:2-dehydro-3-deoxyphosphogluconate aldolase/(4S)-4-hydroxy-2-oxoglutarate aldolase